MKITRSAAKLVIQRVITASEAEFRAPFDDISIPILGTLMLFDCRLAERFDGGRGTK